MRPEYSWFKTVECSNNVWLDNMYPVAKMRIIDTNSFLVVTIMQNKVERWTVHNSVKMIKPYVKDANEVIRRMIGEMRK
jgi:hypothetical protein